MIVTKQNKRLFAIFTFAAALLLVPFFAMQFTNEVNWQLFDFLVGGILLFGTGFCLELILRRVKAKKNRFLLAVVLFLLLALIWGELAVGLFGTAFAGS